jgi:outer membrane protein OmpA-like peptidoglycan-associated protein
MHIKTITLIIIFSMQASSAFSAVYETRGNNSAVYKKDIEYLNKQLKLNPSDMLILERLIKFHFTSENFEEVVKYSDLYLQKNNSKEILYLKIISLANLSDYSPAIIGIETLLKKYSVSEEENKSLTNKVMLYKKYLQTKSTPKDFMELEWAKGKTALGIIYRMNLLVGYDNDKKEPLFQQVKDSRMTNEKQPEFFHDLNLENLIFFSISPDGREIFASITEGEDRTGILYRQFLAQEKVWSSWQRIPVLNNSSINNYANFMPDGLHAIFVSDRDKKNGLDIYIARRNSKNEWQEPVKLAGINTSLDEPSVIIQPDGETIYFSSNGREGSGGYDLFGAKIVKDREGYFAGGIKNITEINTYRNEIRPPLFNLAAEEAFFNFSVSDLATVYHGNIEFRPKPAAFLDIYIYDAETKSPLKADIKIIGGEDKGTGSVHINSTGSDGFAGFSLKKNREYTATISSPGYVYISDQVQIEISNVIEKKYYLKKGRIDKGYSFVADNIYFDTGSAEIKDESFPGIERLFDFLIKNPGIKVNIIGNTDNVGSFEFNMLLSHKRSESIANYLIVRGISKLRVVTEGLGYLKSAAPNISETGRQKNRRVEIIVISSE